MTDLDVKWIVVKFQLALEFSFKEGKSSHFLPNPNKYIYNRLFGGK